MRYFLLIFALCVVTVVGIAGRRGSLSRRPPIEIFPDMNRQPRLRPQTPDDFFADGRSSRMPIPGTIAQEDTHYEDLPVNTGRVTGTTNFVETIPVEVTAKLLARGQQRFNINCSPCHGMQADGNGVVKKLGLATVANLHDKRIVELADGEIFNTITYGKNTMGPYGANVTIDDRWAIIAYLRALQLSQLGTVDDVPEPARAALK
ncbi:MAG TPA: cytochrome c [Verrucomicrobiae bacterium]|jgi:mono/diheme cytochrome c family protein|nr:cytochrome c [Verrucomicrobiae bacterium]